MRIYAYLIVASAFFTALPALAAPKVRIVEIAVIDDGASENSSLIPSVDTSQDNCGTDAEPEAEPFYDSVAQIKIKNRGTSIVKFSSFSFQVSIDGTLFTSDKLFPGTPFEVAAGRTGSFVASLFIRADGGRKYFPGRLDPIATRFGPKAVKFILSGRDGNRKKVNINATTTVSFSNFDRCP